MAAQTPGLASTIVGLPENAKALISLLEPCGLKLERLPSTKHKNGGGGLRAYCADPLALSAFASKQARLDPVWRDAALEALAKLVFDTEVDDDASNPADASTASSHPLHWFLVPLGQESVLVDNTGSTAERPHRISVAGGMNHSLAQVLLRVDTLQQALIAALLDTFSTVALAQVAMGDAYAGLYSNLALLILHQLRWLDYIVDSKGLADKLLESVDAVCSMDAGENEAYTALQREVVSLLPEIVCEEQHTRLVGHLQLMLRENRQLTVPVIEALSNLQVPSSQITALTAAVLDILRSSALQDIPVAIKFLLEVPQRGTVQGGSDSVACLNIVHELRQRLVSVTKAIVPQQSNNAAASAPGQQDSDGDAAGASALVLRVLTNGLLVRDGMAKAFLASIGAACAPGQTRLARQQQQLIQQQAGGDQADTGTGARGKPTVPTPTALPLSAVDIWTLIALFKSPRYQKEAFALLKKHTLVTQILTPQLLTTAVVGRRDVLEAVFPQVLELASKLLSFGRGGSTRAMRDRGALLYRLAFREFDDAYKRQEIAHTLMMHCGGGPGTSDEVDAALRCLVTLCDDEDDVVALHPYSEFIKHLTTSADHMTNNQVRLVFRAVTRLAVTKSIRRTTSARPRSESNDVNGSVDEAMSVMEVPANMSNINGASSTQLSQTTVTSGVSAGSRARNNNYDDDDGGDVNWLNILMRKLTNSPDINRRIVGILCTTQYLITLAPPATIAVAGETTSTAVIATISEITSVQPAAIVSRRERKMRAKRNDVAYGIFKSVLHACHGNAHAMAFLFDELACAFEQGALHEDLMHKVSEHASDVFEKHFTIGLLPDEEDEDDGARGSSAVAKPSEPFSPPLCFGAALRSSLWMNQDGVDASIAMDVIHLLSVGEHNPKIRDSLVYVCPLLRCMMACDESGEAFDAVLGCPLLLPDESVFASFSERPRHVREAVCLSLFHAVNWVRELVNTFWGIEGMHNQSKVVARLDDLLELEDKLEECVRQTPSFVSVLVSMCVLSESIAGGGGGTKKAKSASKDEDKPEKSNVEDDADENNAVPEDDEEATDSDATTAVKRKKTSAKGKRKAKPKVSSQQGLSADKVVAKVKSALRALKPMSCGVLVYPDIEVKQVNSMSQTLDGSRMYVHLDAAKVRLLLRVLEKEVKSQIDQLGGPAGKKKGLPPGFGASGGAGVGDDGTMRFGPEHNSAVINLGLSEQALHGNTVSRITSSVTVVVSSLLPQDDAPPASSSRPVIADDGLLCLEYLSKSTLPAVRKHLDGLCASGWNIPHPLARDESIGLVCRSLLHAVKHIKACGTGEGDLATRQVLRNVLAAFEANDATTLSHDSDEDDDDGEGGTATASAGASLDSQRQNKQLAMTCRNVFKYFSAVCAGGVLQSLTAHLPVLELLRGLDTSHRTFASVAKGIRQQANHQAGDGSKVDAANECAEELYQIAKTLLEKDWAEESSAMMVGTGTGNSANAYNKDCVQALVGALLEGGARRRNGEKPFEGVGELANEIVSAQTNKFLGVMYPGLTKSTLHNFYSGALSGLVKTFRGLELGKLYVKRGSKVSWKIWVGDDDIEHGLDHLHWAVTELKNLVLLTKVNDRRVVLSAAVREGYAFVELFKSTAMPFLSAAFSTDREPVLHILSNLQTTTRQLRSLCAYGKEKKDANLMRATPALKRSLETLIYQAKLLCTTHDCLDLFKSGVLKRRNIDGSAQVEEREESSEGEGSGSGSDGGESQSEEEVSEEEDEAEERHGRGKSVGSRTGVASGKKGLTRARKRAVFGSGSDDEDEDDAGSESGEEEEEERMSARKKRRVAEFE